jgi:hypothetical protein
MYKGPSPISSDPKGSGMVRSLRKVTRSSCRSADPTHPHCMRSRSASSASPSACCRRKVPAQIRSGTLRADCGPGSVPFSPALWGGHVDTVARIEHKRNPGLTRRLASAGCCAARPSRMSLRSVRATCYLLPRAGGRLASIRNLTGDRRRRRRDDPWRARRIPAPP